MEKRVNKFSKDPTKIRLYLLIGLLMVLIASLVLIFMVENVLDDTTVAVDTEAQKTLDKAYEDKSYMSFNVTEEDFQNMLHKMTHQKVIATLKYGSIKLTKKNVKGMLVILDQNEYKHEDLYREILNEWEENDFSNIIENHNDVWELLGEPDGKAISKASGSKERKFIEKNFKQND